MHPLTLCVDAGMVIRRVAFPDDTAIQRTWDNWRQNNSRIVAPGLLDFEVTNVLFRYQLQGHLSHDSVILALQTALALPIELFQSQDLHLNAYRMAQKFNLSAAYDAHYLALAEMLGAEFWTADMRLFKALEKYQLNWIKTII